MRAWAGAVVEAGGVLKDVSSQPPLTLRRVDPWRPGLTALCLVGTAAGPLPGDDLHLALDVRDGARAQLTATGATIAQGRGGPAATIAMSVKVGERAHLDADPGTLIVCDGARVDVLVTIDLAATASLVWREVLVLGRTGETPGTAALHWDVRRAGRPLLRQSVALDPADDWPGTLAGHRVMVTELRCGPDVNARTVVHTPHAVTQRLTDDTELTTVLAADAAAALAVLGRRSG